MTPVHLTLNAGSSTLKFRAYHADDHRLLLRGLIDHFGAGDASLALDFADGRRETRRLADTGRERALPLLLATLADAGLVVAAAIHRVVHGGRDFAAPVALTAAVREQLAALSALAPLHQPTSLAVVEQLAEARPTLPQIACFDTAFHAKAPALNQRFAIARHWYDEGVRRYGFHGLSYAAIARRLPEYGLADARVVVCHLGSGASACGMVAGQSVASTMGFSALDGLMMGTRAGLIDPEVLLYWQETHGMDIKAVRDELYKKSGLLGVSGLSSDMRVLLESDAPEAHEAVELFCSRAAREVASLSTAIGGLDALVFTAGIGEHSAEVRANIVARLGWLGLALDASANHEHDAEIASPDSSADILVIPTDEEGEMLAEALPLLA
ncbi:acetate kinase [Crenobacter luteus]|uniref:acetate/propionate family kinase n=1 Tax=Crenobacter luteus TaxID=1452487 RepID=UPI0010499ED2|nr:acetate/propionate family kinase [Crenobacter luteus]TCP12669.1 acetate kinase [Crenobacter luteus]